MSMKVISVSLHQVHQMTTARKSFILLVNGKWQTKSDWTSLVQQRMGSTAYAVFQLTIDINTEAEEYCIEYLGLKSLPSLVMFSHGNLMKIAELSLSASTAPLSDFRNASYLLDEFKRYHARNVAVVESLRLSHNHGSSSCKLFLSGDRSSVGKSSMCLAMLVSLLKRGVPPSALAYIKPVTQCEAEQPVTQFCDRVGIANRGIGPVVFYKGFTRAYLAGETGTAESLLEEAKVAVEEISEGKQFVLVDGVGYPSVGSICNISNADVARKLDAPVLLIGKSGVGDAVDSYNLNSAYFQLKGVHVLGGIFNKLPLDGYYSLEACRESVTSYFQQHNRTQLPYGFVPLLNVKPDAHVSFSDSSSTTEIIEINEAGEVNSSAQAAMDVCATSPETVPKNIAFTEFENALSDAFMRYVDMDRLIHDVWIYEVRHSWYAWFLELHTVFTFILICLHNRFVRECCPPVAHTMYRQRWLVNRQCQYQCKYQYQSTHRLRIRVCLSPVWSVMVKPPPIVATPTVALLHQ